MKKIKTLSNLSIFLLKIIGTQQEKYQYLPTISLLKIRTKNNDSSEFTDGTSVEIKN